MENDIFNKENYIDKKLLIFWRIIYGFFVIYKRKLDFFVKMIYAYKQAEQMKKQFFSGRILKRRKLDGKKA